jgi:hypothetical protein
VDTCRVCGRNAKVIACIEDPAVICRSNRHWIQGYRSPILARRRKPACSANSAESSCFTHVAIRNGFDRVSARLIAVTSTGLWAVWVSEDKNAQEVWVADNEGSMLGFGVGIGDNKVGFYEMMSIRQGENGSWLFTVFPSGQVPASFQAVDLSKGNVLSSNPDHDYPQEIRTKRTGRRLFATVSLIGEVNPNSFEKFACE